jgi:hypothetical protein
MTPKRPNYPYDCPLLLSKEDVTKFRDANVNLAEIAAMLKEVRELTIDNHHTIRGYNGDDGLIARLTRLEERLNDVTLTVETLKEVPEKLAVVDTLKDVPAVIAEWKRYPSLTWMIRHRFKEMSIVTAAAVALTILMGFPNYYVGERLQALIELLFAKWLRM